MSLSPKLLMELRDGPFSNRFDFPYTESRFEELTGHKFSKTKEELDSYYNSTVYKMRCVKCGTEYSMHLVDNIYRIITLYHEDFGKVLTSEHGKMTIYPDHIFTCEESSIVDILD
jgi:hypothetical protein